MSTGGPPRGGASPGGAAFAVCAAIAFIAAVGMNLSGNPKWFYGMIGCGAFGTLALMMSWNKR